MSTHGIIDLPTRHLFGLDFVDAATIDEVARPLLASASDLDDRWRCVVTPNVDHLVRYRHNPLEADVGQRAGLVLPDGMPIVWASRLLGRPLKSRLTGADLFAALWRGIIATQMPVVVIAARQEVADRLAADHPGLRSIVPPMFSVEDTPAVDSLVERTLAACSAIDARFLVVGVSMPKHHLIADRLRRRWTGGFGGTPTVLLLGQSPEFAVGLVDRAPPWMQRSGLEWLWRLADDPRRLAKRYLVDDPQFAVLLWQEWLQRRESTLKG